MTDIVERLCALAAIDGCRASIEAADTITTLRAENERLRAALRQIAGIDDWDDGEQGFVDNARAVLATQPASDRAAAAVALTEYDRDGGVSLETLTAELAAKEDRT